LNLLQQEDKDRKRPAKEAEEALMAAEELQREEGEVKEQCEEGD